tara:strand:+ start:10140 stop:10757 length:618 start_codon:yes stop_codon:yes gene_type:complete
MSKKMVTPPKAWRAWKPFRQRGLGLGKALTGALQVITPTSSSMYDKLDYMSRGDSLGSAAGRFATTDYKPFHEYETWLEKYKGKRKMSDFSNRDIMKILTSGSRDDIRGFLHAKGIDDYNWELTNLIQDKFPDLIKKEQKMLGQTEREIDSVWNQFGSPQMNPTGFGTNKNKTRDQYLNIQDRYGDSAAKIVNDIINEAMANIGD